MSALHFAGVVAYQQGRHADAEPLYRAMLSAKELDTVTSLNSLAALRAGADV